MTRPAPSLVFRAIAASSLMALAGLAVIATLIVTLYRQAAEDNFGRLLSAHLFNLIGAVGLSPDGRLVGSPDLGDLRFTIPRSGWYWSVEMVAGAPAPALLAPSLSAPLASPPATTAPFDDEYRRSWRGTGPAGEAIEARESEFELDDAGHVARFTVTGNRDELEADIAAFRRTLALWLGGFGLASIAVNALAIRFSLRPLDRVRKALADIREGRSERLDGAFPVEVAPLAAETNALIDANRRTVERARTQVGNLAHSLKTPLAVITNEGRALGGERGGLIAGQAAAMRTQVDHYLKRARIAAQADSVAFRTPVSASLQRLVRVAAKLNPDLAIRLELEPGDLVFAGEREDFEEILGNLVENAGKWARSTVLVSARRDGHHLVVSVEDDGPGIPDDRAREAVKRGRRLDETKPGSGLGLSIVSDLVEEYRGGLVLGRSPLGGLKAEVTLRPPG